MNTRQLEGTGAGSHAAEATDVTVRQVAFEAPWVWLTAGWRDLWAAPSISVAYGALFAMLAAGMVLGLTVSGLESLILALGGGLTRVPMLVRCTHGSIWRVVTKSQTAMPTRSKESARRTIVLRRSSSSHGLATLARSTTAE